ncbi:hypothetical protein C366_01657 [Cryptococcus neoformans Tu401-1]|nr:hypothetical protein C366_01657 [Cryptococcus neoformans var. grubii Tu401-1]
MFLHDLLEQCFEFIAMDGAIGCQPTALQKHLSNLNSSFDKSTFNYVWRSLCLQPTIEIILTSDLFTTSIGHVATVKGKKRKYGNQVDSHDLIRILCEDNGAQRKGEEVSIKDYEALSAKWGDRLRIRCTEDEIYFRLTGQHERLSSLTADNFQVLQLIAMSRENGIALIDLDSSSGLEKVENIHARVDVLTDLGLCVRLSQTIRNSIGSILVHYKFLHLNSAYLSLCRLNPELQDTLPPDVSLSHMTRNEDNDDFVNEADEEEDQSVNKLRLDFSPLTETEVSSGHIIRERLLKTLDHPELKNHLLRQRGLLYALGWVGPVSTKQRRAVERIIRALVDSGVIERVAAGDKKILCIRLTKYRTELDKDVLEISDNPKKEVQEDRDCLQVIAHRAPYQSASGISMSQALDYQVLDLIVQAGTDGIIKNDLWRKLNFMVSRSFDQVIERVTVTTTPNHLWSRIIIRTRENESREQRHRYFSISSFLDVARQLGRDSDLGDAAKEPGNVGQFADISCRSRYHGAQEYLQALGGAITKKAIKSQKKDPKDFKYQDSTQKRGRPSTTIVVYDAHNGGRNRGIIGAIPVQPDLPARLIYDSDSGLVMTPSPLWSGKGAHPPFTEEQRREGKEPAWFDRYPHAKERATPRNSKKVKGKGRSEVGAATNAGSVDTHESRQIKRIKSDVDRKEDMDKQLSTASPGPSAVTSDLHGDSIRQGISADETSINTSFSSLLNAKGQGGKAPKNNRSGIVSVPSEVNHIGSPVTGPATKTQSLNTPVASSGMVDDAAQRVPVVETSGLSEASKEVANTLVDLSNLPQLSESLPVSLPASPTVLSVHHTHERSSGPKGCSNGEPRLTKSFISSASPVEAESVTASFTQAQAKIIEGDAKRKGSLMPASEQPSLKSARLVKGEEMTNVSAGEMRYTPDQRAVPSLSPASLSVEAAMPTLSSDDGEGREATPLKEMPPSTSLTPLPARLKKGKSIGSTSRKSSTPRGLLDLRESLQAEELLQFIHDFGGIIAQAKIQNEHHAWTVKHAGSSHPHSPSRAYTMDRTTIKRALGALDRQGRLRHTTTQVATTLGTFSSVKFYYVPDLPSQQLNSHINRHRHETAQTGKLFRSSVATELPQIEFSDFHRSDPSGGKVSVAPLEESAVKSNSERRDLLLTERDVVSQLYGYKFGMFVRVRILHCAIVNALKTPDSPSIISTSPRIFSLTLLFEELQAKDWYAIMQYTKLMEDIVAWLGTPSNGETKLKDVPPEFRPPKGFGGSLPRDRIGRLLDVLATLKILTPLVGVHDGNRDIKVGEQMSFRVADSSVAPYYVLHDYAPVYHVALGSRAPLLGLLPVMFEGDIIAFWGKYREAVRDNTPINLPDKIDQASNSRDLMFPSIAHLEDPIELDASFLRRMQTRARWDDKPRLTTLQQDAIRDAIDWSRATIHITSPEALENFAYENALPISIIQAELQSGQKRARENIAHREERLRDSARRAQERQERRLRSYQERIAGEEAASRQAWEERVATSAVRKGVPYDSALLDFVSSKAPANMKKANVTDGLVDYWVGVWELCKEMDGEERGQLLAQGRVSLKQKDKGADKKLKRRAKGKKATGTPGQGEAPDVEGTTTKRKNRSKRKWTTEDDELMLDSEAIIRARSRTNAYKGRAAMSQLYPRITASTFRMRIMKIAGEPGKLAYLERLEQAWYELWLKYRGTEELPDDNIESSVEFDLKAHIDFLRKHVDKRTLKLLAASTPITSGFHAPDLPCDIFDLHNRFDWEYSKTSRHTFDTVAESLSAEEIRLNNLARKSLIHSPTRGQTEMGSNLNREMGKLRAVMKLIVATPAATYDIDCGERLLSSWDTSIREMATAELVDAGVFRKHLVGATAGTAGRFYDFTAQWQQLSDGPLPSTFWEEAEVLETKLKDAGDEGFEWPLIGQSGELGKLMSMVSNDEAEFSFNIKDFPAINIPHYNTRKLNDDAYEFDFKVKRSVLACPPLAASAPNPFKCNVPSPWNTTALDVEQSRQVLEAASRVIDAVIAAGPEGITKSSLQNMLNLSINLLEGVFNTFQEDSPAVFWSGYDTARLVAAEFWPSWTIRTRPFELKEKKESERFTTPRRWLDVYGQVLHTEWIRAVNRVASHLMMRPGISQRRLRGKLDLILDRLELVDVLEYLVKRGIGQRRWMGPGGMNMPPVEATSIEEEEWVVWSLDTNLSFSTA